LISADFDNNGFEDIAAIDHFSSQLSILFNGQKSRDRGRCLYDFFVDIEDLNSADFDRDGRRDLVVVGYSSQMKIFLNRGVENNRCFEFEQILIGSDPGLRLVQTADFNADGYDDLVVAGTSHNTRVHLNLGSGASGRWRGFSDPIFVAQTPFPSDLDTGDFNNDGQQDIAINAHSLGSDGLWVLWNDGIFIDPKTKEIQWRGRNQHLLVDVYPDGLRSADFNEDSFDDIALVYELEGLVQVLLSEGGGRFDVKELSVGLGAKQIRAADIDGDLDIDLITANSLSGSISLLLNKDASGVFSYTGFNFPVHKSIPSSLLVGDFNTDSRPDIVTGSGDFKDLSILLNRP
jgi:hypothetical protein